MRTNRIIYAIIIGICTNFGFATADDSALSVEDAVKIAINNNNAVLTAKSELESARGRHQKSGSLENPELKLEWEAIPPGKFLGDAEERKIGISQYFEFPAKYFLRSGIAEIGVKIAEEKLKRAESIASADIKRAYHKMIFQQKVLSNMESNIELLKQILEGINIKYQAGSVPYIEIVRTKVELAKIRNELIDIKREISAQKREFNLLLGREANEQLRLSGESDYKSFDADLKDIKDKYFDLNSTYKVKKLILEQNKQGLSLANAGFMPDFNFGIFSHRYGGLEPKDGLAVELGISIPLWFFWKQGGEAREASSNERLSRTILEFSDKNIKASIENAFENVKTAEEQVKNFESTILAEIEDEMKSGITGYQNGKIDTLNLIDIYRTYKNTKIEYYKSLYNYRVALIDLEVAGEEIE